MMMRVEAFYVNKFLMEIVMSASFAREFQDVTEGVRQAELARAMAKLDGKDKDPRYLVGSLSRISRGNQTPKTEMISQIAEAVGSIKRLSPEEVETVRERLAGAARPANWRTSAELDVSDSDHRGRLHPECKRILRKVDGLSERKIDQILKHIGVPTMKLIIAADKRGEEIEVVALQELSAELPQPTEGEVTEKTKKADTIITAGRAQISIEGDVSREQMQVLQYAAEMIESVLKL